MNKKTDKPNSKTIALNPKARYEYFIENTVEAGIMLTGAEVKSLRVNGGTIKEAHAGQMDGAIYIFNMHIPEYKNARLDQRFEVDRPRKLLLHEREIKKMIGAVTREGYTIVPTALYFNGRGRAKLEIALAKGKKLHDKRATIKERDWNREKQRLLK